MISISYQDNPSLYMDYEECLLFLKSIQESDYQYPEDITNFHLYSEIKNEKELLSVKSFFATQNLDKCHLILWSDWDVPNNELLKPFRDKIEFRVYNPGEEVKGTILEGYADQVHASDGLHYMQSGLLRFLAGHKYGGVWFDMDMVLLRDLKPLLGQEFAYMWGSETDFNGFGPCAAFMSIFKDSEHSRICLEELTKSPIVPNTVCRDHQMLAKVYKRMPFTIFPSVFFDTEWQINVKNPGLGTDIEQGWFRKTELSNSYLFLEAFAWHWHNSSYRDYVPEAGSKFHLLNKIIDYKLKERGFS